MVKKKKSWFKDGYWGFLVLVVVILVFFLVFLFIYDFPVSGDEPEVEPEYCVYNTECDNDDLVVGFVGAETSEVFLLRECNDESPWWLRQAQTYTFINTIGGGGESREGAFSWDIAIGFLETDNTICKFIVDTRQLADYDICMRCVE